MAVLCILRYEYRYMYKYSTVHVLVFLYYTHTEYNCTVLALKNYQVQYEYFLVRPYKEEQVAYRPMVLVSGVSLFV